MTEQQLTKIFCNRCRQETNHRVVAQHLNNGSAVIDGYYNKIHWEDRYEMLECCGCETVVFKHEYIFSEDPEPSIVFYPPRISRPLPKWKYELPYPIMSLLGEVYTALHAGSHSLALMGARTIVDMVIVEKVGDIGTFAQKLEQLEKQGVVSKGNRLILGAALDAGSAAAHRGYVPKDEELQYVMDIIENLLEAVYILEKLAKKLKETTPPKKAGN